MSTISELAAAKLRNDTFAHMEELITIVLQLHGDPCSLFLSCVMFEIGKSKNLSSVMRERSLSVRILQYIWRTYSVASLTSELITFIHSLSATKLSVIKDGAPSKKREKLKQKLTHSLKNIFRVDSLPTVVCVLCYRCTLLAESMTDLKLDENQTIIQWSVSALIFLRFIVPSITSIACDASVSPTNKKASVLMGKLLMKMCCKSTFSGRETFLNEILEESKPIFDRYCDNVLRMGAENAHLIGSYSILITRLNSDEGMMHDKRSRLYDFLSTFGANVVLTGEMLANKCGLSGSSPRIDCPTPSLSRDVSPITLTSPTHSPSPSPTVSSPSSPFSPNSPHTPSPISHVKMKHRSSRVLSPSHTSLFLPSLPQSPCTPTILDCPFYVLVAQLQDALTKLNNDFSPFGLVKMSHTFDVPKSSIQGMSFVELN
jgi:hypothetical protein